MTIKEFEEIINNISDEKVETIYKHFFKETTTNLRDILRDKFKRLTTDEEQVEILKDIKEMIE